MEKETLEEAAENHQKNTIGIALPKHTFIEGAKWQAERMYSEDDLKEAFKQSRQAFIFQKDMPCVYDSFEEWFKQFKKK